MKKNLSGDQLSSKKALKNMLKGAIAESAWQPSLAPIDEILLEAGAHNLRAEVKASAELFMADDPNLDEANAYNMAYLKWINE